VATFNPTHNLSRSLLQILATATTIKIKIKIKNFLQSMHSVRERERERASRRGVCDGAVENKHLHWKNRELVKILVKVKTFNQTRNCIGTRS
jgi:hypothetical protein